MNFRDVNLQIAISLFMGIFFGMFSYGMFWMILFLFSWETYIISISSFYPPGEKLYDRLIINSAFIFGWIISRILYLRESGFEGCITECQKYYYINDEKLKYKRINAENYIKKN